jgi:glycosyltransferase involved in cell wall biosynthesis
MTRAAIDLSLVIACYNEESYLVDHVRQIRRTLGLCPWSYELIFIDDGSTDRTREILGTLGAGRDDSTVVLHEHNVGRGGTVSEGFRQARGEVVGFLDIDLEVHCRYLPSLVQAIVEDGFDVATAHRIYKVNLTPAGALRWLLSAGYRLVARRLLGSPFADTETGFKFFRRAAVLPLLDRCRDRHWFWDTEIMLEALRAGLKVIEVPALFQRRPSDSSSLRVVPDTLAYVRAIRAYRRRRRDEARSAG